MVWRFVLSLCVLTLAFEATAQNLTKENYWAWMNANPAYQASMAGPRTPESELSRTLAEGTFKAFDTGGAAIEIRGSNPKEQLFWVYYQAIRDGRLMKQKDIAQLLAGHHETLRAFAGITKNQDVFRLEKAQEIIYAAMASGHNAVELNAMSDKIKSLYKNEFGRLVDINGRELILLTQKWNIPYLRTGSNFDSLWRFWNIYDFSNLEHLPAEADGSRNIPTPLYPVQAQVVTVREKSLKDIQLGRFRTEMVEAIDWEKAVPHKGKAFTKEIREALVDAFIASGARGPNAFENALKSSGRAPEVRLNSVEGQRFINFAFDASRDVAFRLAPQAAREKMANEAKLLLREIFENVQVTVGDTVEERSYLDPHASQIFEIVEFSILNGRSGPPPDENSYTYIEELAPYLTSVIKAEQGHTPALSRHLEALQRKAERYLKRSLSAEEISTIAEGQAYLFAARVVQPSGGLTPTVLRNIEEPSRNPALEAALRGLGLLPPENESHFWTEDIWRNWGLSIAERPVDEFDPMPKRMKRVAIRSLEAKKNINLSNPTAAEIALAHEIYHRTNILTTDDGPENSELSIESLKRAIRMLVHKSPTSVEEFKKYLENAALMRTHTGGGPIVISDRLAEDIMRQAHFAMSAHFPRVNCRSLAESLANSKGSSGLP